MNLKNDLSPACQKSKACRSNLFRATSEYFDSLSLVHDDSIDFCFSVDDRGLLKDLVLVLVAFPLSVISDLHSLVSFFLAFSKHSLQDVFQCNAHVDASAIAVNTSM